MTFQPSITQTTVRETPLSEAGAGRFECAVAFTIAGAGTTVLGHGADECDAFAAALRYRVSML